jgi:hypothetical protein
LEKTGSGSFGFWLRFRSVTGRCGHAPSLSLAKTPKSLAAERLQFFFKRSNLPFGHFAKIVYYLDVNQAAYILRENTGTSGIIETARTAVSVLAQHDIPHLIVGGLAVQEHGYPRVTIDVDIVVPDVLEAVEFLTASLTGPFYRVHDIDDRVEDRRNGVEVDLLPAGRTIRRNSKIPFPEVKTVTETPQIISLEDLISLKLDSWSGSPNRRLKDKADVIELIKYRKLSRDLAIHPAVRALYVETWDALQAEK